MTKRNTVPCNGCTACCRGQDVILSPENGDHLEDYDAVYKGSDRLWRLKLVDGERLGFPGEQVCVYLTANGCGIHDRAPWACRQFDCRRWLNREPEAMIELLRPDDPHGEIARAACARMALVTPPAPQKRCGSFPYLAIAQDLRRPYAEVLAVAEVLDKIGPFDTILDKELYCHVENAWLAERGRRHIVNPAEYPMSVRGSRVWICKMCGATITTAELCTKCAAGNDPFLSCDNAGSDLRRP